MSIRKTEYGYQVDLRANGIRHKKTFKLREDAREFERDLILKKKGEVGVSPFHRMTMQQALDAYSEHFSSRKSQVTQANEKKYFLDFSTFMKSQGLTHIHEIEIIHLQRLQKHIASRGVSGATVNRQFNTYKNFLRECRLWKAHMGDPCFGLKSMKYTERKKVLWKYEDVWKVHDAMKNAWQQDGFYFCVTTGQRPKPILSVEWRDVNLEEKTMTITNSKGTGNERLVTVTLSDDQIKRLKAIHARQKKERHINTYVFANKKGLPGKRIHLTNKVTELAKQFGIKGRLYGVKHTLASNLRAQGTDIETIRQVLGHANLNTTQKYLQNLSSHEVVRNALESVQKKMK